MMLSVLRMCSVSYRVDDEDEQLMEWELVRETKVLGEIVPQ
jgi:hypothetical protein